MKYISNGFSPKMLNPKTNPGFTVTNATYDEIQNEKEELISSIGHQTIADHLDIEKNRMNIQLEADDILYLVQIYHDDENALCYDYRKITITHGGC